MCYIFCSEVIPAEFKVKGNIFSANSYLHRKNKDEVDISENFQVKFTKLQNIWEITGKQCNVSEFAYNGTVKLQQWKLGIILFNDFDHFTGKIFHNWKTYFLLCWVDGQWESLETSIKFFVCQRSHGSRHQILKYERMLKTKCFHYLSIIWIVGVPSWDKNKFCSGILMNLSWTIILKRWGYKLNSSLLFWRNLPLNSTVKSSQMSA